mmetsp:Transcript_95911/g.253338  ORF Transcript_95911/g.253338 Transcript_95911/m.253338 type:complete len:249 (-) Transcript_95911:57-803(-)
MVAAGLHKVHVDLSVQKHLSDDEIGACVALLLHVVHLLLEVRVAAHGHDAVGGHAGAALLAWRQGRKAALHHGDGIGVALRVAGHRNAEVIAVLLAHVLHKVQRAVEAALGGGPLLLAAGRVAPQRHDVADADLLAISQGVARHLDLLVRAGEVHVGNGSKLVLGGAGQLQRELRGGAAGTPGEVREQRAEPLHAHNPLLQILDTLGRLGREVLEGKPSSRRLGHEVRDLVVIGEGGHDALSGGGAGL